MIDREEQDLNNALSALGSAEPMPGMENRILQRLAGQPAATQLRPSRMLWWSSSLAFATAAIAIILYWTHPHPSTLAPAPVAQIQPALTPDTPSSPRLGGPPSAGPSLRVGRTIATPTRSPQPPVETADRGAASLPSMLAPEAPLTDQERQLLRIAHHPDKTDLALLNPQVREEIAHQSAADFERFFPKPTDQEIYLAEHANN